MKLSLMAAATLAALSAGAASACSDVFADVSGFGHQVDVLDEGCGTYLSLDVNGAFNRQRSSASGVHGVQVLSTRGFGNDVATHTGGVGASIGAHIDGSRTRTNLSAYDGASIGVVQTKPGASITARVVGDSDLRIFSRP
jgi:hypothetical protein